MPDFSSSLKDNFTPTESNIQLSPSKEIITESEEKTLHESKSDLIKHDPNSVSMFQTIINGAKCALGAGLIGVPMAFAQATMAPAILFSLISLIVSGFSFWIVGYISEFTNAHTYGQMWSSIFSDPNLNCVEFKTHTTTNKVKSIKQNIFKQFLYSGHVIDAIIACYNITSAAVFLLISSNNLITVTNWHHQPYIILSISIGALIPLNFLDLRKFSFVSLLGMFVVASLAFTVIIANPAHKQQADNFETQWKWYKVSLLGWLAAMGDMSMAFTSHYVYVIILENYLFVHVFFFACVLIFFQSLQKIFTLPLFIIYIRVFLQNIFFF